MDVPKDSTPDAFVAPDSPGFFRRVQRRVIATIHRRLRARGRSLEITKSGWIFILLTLGVGFAAINSGANLLHILFGCQLGLIVASGVLSERMLGRADVERRLQALCFANRATPLAVHIRNRSDRSPLLAVSVETHATSEPSKENAPGQQSPVFALALRPGATVTLHAQVVLSNRGYHRLPSVVLATRFPFGLFIKRKALDDDALHVVMPEPASIAATPLPGAAQSGNADRRQWSRAGELEGLREYRPGDDIRRVDWRATARLSRTMLREFRDESEPSRLYDLPRELSPGDIETERVLSKICTAALQCEEQGLAI